MEQNRNIHFDSEVEIDSLKDAVWRLTTRIYLLEDFIAEKFGEVLTSTGFSTSTFTVPGFSVQQTSKFGVASQNLRTECAPKRRRKRRVAEDEREKNKVQKSFDTAVTLESNGDMESLRSEENITDLPWVPKDEVVLPDDVELDDNDEFLNNKSDDDEVSLEKDPDFLPLHDTEYQTKKPQRKKRIRSKHNGTTEEKVSVSDSRPCPEPKSRPLHQLPRKSTRKDHIWTYFKDGIGENGEKVECQICQIPISRGGTGKKATNSNMVRHLQRKHKVQYECYIAKKNEAANTNENNNSRNSSQLTLESSNVIN